MRLKTRSVAGVLATITLTAFVGLAGPVPARANPPRPAPSVPMPPSGTGSQHGLYAVDAFSATDAWAVGSDMKSGLSGYRTVTRHWDGTSWKTIPSPNPGPGQGGNELFSVAEITPSNVWAVGDHRDGSTSKTLVIHWDGTRWTRVPSPNPSSMFDRLTQVNAVSANDVWASSSCSDPTGFCYDVTLHWDGIAWTVVSGQMLAANDISAVTRSDAWAVGVVGQQDGSSQSWAAHWDGATWTPVSIPNPGPLGTNLAAVSADAPDDVWAVGSESSNGAIPFQTVVMHWDGTAWSVVQNKPLENYYAAPIDVSAVSPDDVWMVLIDAKLSRARGMLEHWDGTRWTVVDNPAAHSRHSYLDALSATSKTDAWAVGWAGLRNSRRMLLHWNGSAWTPYHRTP